MFQDMFVKKSGLKESGLKKDESAVAAARSRKVPCHHKYFQSSKPENARGVAKKTRAAAKPHEGRNPP